MRIAYLVNRYPSVSHTFIRREIHALEARGLKVDRYSVRDTSDSVVHPEDKREADLTTNLLDNGAAVRILMATVLTVISKPTRFLKALSLSIKLGRRAPSGLVKHLIYVTEACLLRRWLAKSGVAAVHAHFGTNSTTVAMLCHVLGGPPYSFTVHGPEEFDHPEEWGLKTKAKHAQFVAAVSSYGRSQLFRWLDPDDWSKVNVVRCGIDPQEFDGGSSVTDEPNLVCVGRICEQKGHGVLIKALGELKRRGVAFHVTLAGDGEMREQIEDEIRRESIEDSVAITGWIDSDRVRELLDQSQGLVLPSFAEGLPVVIMESMAMSRPVISTYIAGIPELVEDRTHGWLIPAGAVDRLADAIQELLECPSDRLAAIGQENREQVCRYHDIHSISEQLAELIVTGSTTLNGQSDSNGSVAEDTTIDQDTANTTERVG